ncbi:MULTISPECIES: amidohydrolase family protein [unclassified Streptomyces]|uniref:amidohydrolase family protein n=1 Tax=unclassified Streptomyces TaxID=2593676 RepID=UPI001907CACA|nr:MULTISPECIES: amidohydrolase family protein [unclassified Streptomyces]MCU4745396.1 amidohydrolase family protein [Streptomyces sp. G-5]QQN79595.1 amidohydrolase family protein [Streptomyces sp. XC 2026]
MIQKKSPDDPPGVGEPSEAGATSRRTMLKRAGAAAAGVGVAAAVGGPLMASLSRSDPARSAVMPTAEALRIDHVTVVDPRDGSSRPGMSVLVRDGRIASVTASAEADTTTGVQVIDGDGRFAVPGYNNMHTHVLQEERRSRLFMAAMLAEGTTGMRQMAGSEDLLRHRRERRLPLGVDTPGLHAMPGALLMPFNAPSVSRARDEISRQKELGADFIKLVQVEREVFFDSVGWAHANGLRVAGHLPPSVNPLEASEAGFDCFEHLGTNTNIWIETSSDRGALRGRENTSGAVPNWLGYVPFSQRIFSSGIVSKATAKSLLNPALMNSEETVAILRSALDSFDEGAATLLAETFARNTTWQTPTLVRLRTQYLADAREYEDHPWLEMVSAEARGAFQESRRKFVDLPAETRSTYHRYYETTLKMIKMMHDAGVPLMTGTDGPSAVPGQDLHAEFREMAAAGLKPLDVLRSTTTTPASFLGRSDRMGAVAAGMDADFLLLDADPLKSVDHLAKISAVVRTGHLATRQDILANVDRLLSAAEG